MKKEKDFLFWQEGAYFDINYKRFMKSSVDELHFIFGVTFGFSLG